MSILFQIGGGRRKKKRKQHKDFNTTNLFALYSYFSRASPHFSLLFLFTCEGE
jgi:hypothetical protein